MQSSMNILHDREQEVGKADMEVGAVNELIECLLIELLVIMAEEYVVIVQILHSLN